VLLDLLRADADDEDSRHDVGGDLVPRLVAAGDAHAYDFSTNEVPGEAPGRQRYWRDVGTLDAYFEAHMDLVSPMPAFDLYNEAWPMYTWFPPVPPAKIVQDAAAGPSSVNDSLLCAGVIVSGASVYRSVLSPGVIVEPGARVDGAVLLEGVVIGRGAQVRGAILDKNVVVPPGMVVGSDHKEDAAARGLTVSPGGVVVARKNFRFATP
jgi:glucose-1-phosphate adenylyltransferase